MPGNPLRKRLENLLEPDEESEIKGFVPDHPDNTKGEQQSRECTGSSAAEAGRGLGPAGAMISFSHFCCSQLAADPDPNVKSGSELLDRLLKVFFLFLLRAPSAGTWPRCAYKHLHSPTCHGRVLGTPWSPEAGTIPAPFCGFPESVSFCLWL